MELEKMNSKPNCTINDSHRTAFCLTENLFENNSTCPREPIQQTCTVVSRLVNKIPGRENDCYKEYFVTCQTQNSTSNISEHECIKKRESMLEWCTCDKSNSVNNTESSKDHSDCICFPYHTEKYIDYQYKQDDISTSCLCSNTRRKKCKFPNTGLDDLKNVHCIFLHETLLLEQHMKCDQLNYEEKLTDPNEKSLFARCHQDEDRMNRLRMKFNLDKRTKNNTDRNQLIPATTTMHTNLNTTNNFIQHSDHMISNYFLLNNSTMDNSMIYIQNATILFSVSMVLTIMAFLIFLYQRVHKTNKYYDIEKQKANKPNKKKTKDTTSKNKFEKETFLKLSEKTSKKNKKGNSSTLMSFTSLTSCKKNLKEDQKPLIENQEIAK